MKERQGVVPEMCWFGDYSIFLLICYVEKLVVSKNWLQKLVTTFVFYKYFKNTKCIQLFSLHMKVHLSKISDLEWKWIEEEDIKKPEIFVITKAKFKSPKQLGYFWGNIEIEGKKFLSRSLFSLKLISPNSEKKFVPLI